MRAFAWRLRNHTRCNLRSPPPPHSVILAPGDVLKLTFPGAPEFTQVQKIRSDGRISLPVLGEVRAAGKTVGTLQSQLVGLYKEQLTDSEVIVALESGGARVYMGGAVLKPGPLVLDQPTTMLQAIMLAGGPNQFANMGRVQIIRLVSGQERTEVIDLRPTLAGTTTHPYYVHDGDVISVPQKAF